MTKIEDKKTFEGRVEGGGKQYDVKFTIVEPLTAEVWCTWWEKRAEYLGDVSRERNPGAVLRAKYLAHLDCVVVDGHYVEVGGSDGKMLKTEKMSAPAEVVQWVNLQIDNRMGEVWNVPQPSSAKRPSRG